MATRKQRRRRAKEQRHDYEIVYLDSEGNEVDVADADVRPRVERNGTKPKPRASVRQASRRGQIQPPSWRRVMKRGLIFGPIFLATVLLIGRNHVSLASAIVQAAILIAVFVPFSYMLDSFMWRTQQRRQARGTSAKR